MTFRLTKAETIRCDDLIAKLTGKLEVIQQAILEYNEVLEEVRSFRDGLVERLRKQFSNRPKKWQEGIHGEEVDTFISSWEDIDLDDVEFEPSTDHVQELVDAPSEVLPE